MKVKACSSYPQEEMKKKKKHNKQNTKNKMTDLSPDMSVITLSINGLNIQLNKEIGRVDLKNDPQAEEHLAGPDV